MPELALTTRRDGRRAVLALRGELDMASARRVEAEVERALAGGTEVVVLDLRELEFMDSSGLRAVLRADALARRDGWRLAVVDGREPVRRVFAITGMDQRLTFVADPAAAGGGLSAR